MFNVLRENVFDPLVYGFLLFKTVKHQGERPEFRLAVPLVSCHSCLRRWQSTEYTYDERTKIRTWLDKAKNKNWLYRWINDVDEIEKTVSVMHFSNAFVHF